jgi:hypothetical protein
MTLSPEDLADLQRARALLEQPSLAMRLSNVLGAPIEKGIDFLPDKWSGAINTATRASLNKALDLAVTTLGEDEIRASSNTLHKFMVAATGAGGGVFGLAALPLELPVSTTIMLRSIADIARSEGDAIDTLDTRLACIEVFALGGPGSQDDAAETAYFTVRAALARSITDAGKHLAQKGLIDSSAPAIIRLVGQVAARFGLVVSEKVAAQAVPIIGAAGGSIINLAFMNHFQDMARGHFIVRRLERRYDPGTVRMQYLQLAPPIDR